MQRPHFSLLQLPCIAGLLFMGLQAHAQPPAILNLSTPSPLSGSVIIDKRPTLECTLEGDFVRDEVLVMLDGIDITALLEWDAAGFAYRPPTVLPSGRHNLEIVIGTDASAFAFETRHDERYKTLQTDVTLAGEYAYAVARNPDEGSPSTIDTALGINARAETEHWDTLFTSHLQYADPDRYPEQREKVVLNDFLFRSQYSGDSLGAALEIGDVSIYETEMTLSQLSRRGMQFNLQYEGVTLNTFSVLGDTAYSFDKGVGAGVDDAKNIYGASLASSFFSGRARLKLVYARGGTNNTGIGIGAEPVAQEGNVFGVYAEADLIEALLAVQVEWDRAEFDSDTADTVDAATDNALKIGLGGAYGALQYHLYHTRIGAEYTPIGNEAFVNDQQGFGADAGLFGENQSLNVALSQLRDNTDDDPLLPTVYTETGSVNYAYFGLPQWYAALNYARTMQHGESLPAGSDAIGSDQDDLGGTLQYMAGAWTHLLSLRYSIHDDRFSAAGDAESFDSAFSPAYSPGSPFLSTVSPTLSYLRETGMTSSDTYALNLFLSGTLDGERFRYAFNGSAQRKVYDEQAMDDATSYNASARLEYQFAVPLPWMQSPSAGIKADYRKSDDLNTTAASEVYTVQLFVNLPLAYAF
ncbi:hypothetical protein ACXWTF_03310 [Thiomicrolovo sp. ZZH C-3]